jgi:tetratricopeptide (TPR) repeat protein
VYRRNYSPAKTDDAIASYLKAIEYNPGSAGSNFGMGWCYNEKGKYSDAIPYLNKALELDKNLIAAYTELGYGLYMTGDNTTALKTFNKGIEIDAKNELCRYYAGLTYLKLNDKSGAVKMQDELKQLGSNSLADKLANKIAAAK